MPTPSPLSESRPPREFVGLARHLFRRLDIVGSEVAQQTRAIADTLRAEHQRRHGRIPASVLASVPHQWRRLDPFGRLELRIERPERHSLHIAELRLGAASLRYTDWRNAGVEPSISVELLTVIVDREKFTTNSECVSCFSLHALSRRYERDPRRRSDEEVVHDLACVLRYPPRPTDDRHGICVAIPNGVWVGESVPARSDNGNQHGRIIAVRTFLPDLPRSLQRQRQKPQLQQPIYGCHAGSVPALAEQA